MKGEKGCDSRHIDDGVLYQAFVDVFNAMIENKARFIGKWKERLGIDDSLVRYKVKQFIEMLEDSEAIDEFDLEFYFALVEKVTIYDGGRLVVRLRDGTEIECEI